jgi:hypothetical protein
VERQGTEFHTWICDPAFL